jgi:hypothetical protein
MSKRIAFTIFVLNAAFFGHAGLTGPGLVPPTLPVIEPPHLLDLLSEFPEWESKLRIGIQKEKETRAWFKKLGRGEMDAHGNIDGPLELSESDASHPLDQMDPEQAELQYDLLRAARAGHADRIALLIEAGAAADVSDPETRGRTPLHLAALSGSVPAIEALVRRGAPLHARADMGRTPLHFAVDRPYDKEGYDPEPESYAAAQSAVAALIALGANVNSREDSGRTPLHLAAAAGLAGICELLIRR